MKTYIFSKSLFKQAVIISSILIISLAHASDPQIHPRVHVKDGLAIYLSLMPAEMLEGHIANSMHGGLPTGIYRYHIAIAVFDEKTGQRINNANVQVRISNRIGVGPDSFKPLETMEMGGKVMYGNYFVPKTTGPFRIDVKIYPYKERKPVEVMFQYDVAHT